MVVVVVVTLHNYDSGRGRGRKRRRGRRRNVFQRTGVELLRFVLMHWYLQQVCFWVGSRASTCRLESDGHSNVFTSGPSGLGLGCF